MPVGGPAPTVAAVRAASDPISQLRAAIDCLPVRTREAMLDGIRSNPIVVGAYTDSRGGICPMLAAHRNGGRTSFLSFAKAWDRFAHARAGGVRRATRRELRVLEAQLEASLLAEEDVDLAAAIADHQASVARHGAADEAPQIVARRLTPGAVRRLRPWRRGDAERALARLERDLGRR